MNDIVQKAKHLMLYFGIETTKIKVVVLCFQEAGYTVKSTLVSERQVCDKCNSAMAMHGFAKRTPTGIRPISFRVIGICSRCNHVEEF